MIEREKIRRISSPDSFAYEVRQEQRQQHFSRSGGHSERSSYWKTQADYPDIDIRQVRLSGTRNWRDR